MARSTTWWGGLSAFFLAAAALPACSFSDAEDPDEVVDESESEVRAGSPTSIESVGSLFHGAHAFCTGTLLSPRIVLTAKHCQHAALATSTFGYAPGTSVGIVDGRVFRDADIMVLKLAAPGIPLRRPPALATRAPLEGRAYTIVGSGNDGVGSGRLLGGKVVYSGEQVPALVGIGMLDMYTPGTVRVAGPLLPDAEAPPARLTTACHGDSGGPTLAYERSGGRYRFVVYGIASTIAWDGGAQTYEEVCNKAYQANYVRVADWAPAIEQVKADLEAAQN